MGYPGEECSRQRDWLEQRTEEMMEHEDGAWRVEEQGRDVGGTEWSERGHEREEKTAGVRHGGHVRSKSPSLGPHFLVSVIYIKPPSESSCENVITGVKGSA